MDGAPLGGNRRRLGYDWRRLGKDRPHLPGNRRRLMGRLWSWEGSHEPSILWVWRIPPPPFSPSWTALPPMCKGLAGRREPSRGTQYVQHVTAQRPPPATRPVPSGPRERKKKQGADKVVMLIDSKNNQYTLRRPTDTTFHYEDGTLINDFILVFIMAFVGGSLCSVVGLPTFFGYVITGVILSPTGMNKLENIVQVSVEPRSELCSTRAPCTACLVLQGAHRALCPRCAKSRLFSTTGSHGSQGPEFCTPDAVLNGSCMLL